MFVAFYLLLKYILYHFYVNNLQCLSWAERHSRIRAFSIDYLAIGIINKGIMHLTNHSKYVILPENERKVKHI